MYSAVSRSHKCAVMGVKPMTSKNVKVKNAGHNTELTDSTPVAKLVWNTRVQSFCALAQRKYKYETLREMKNALGIFRGAKYRWSLYTDT